MGRLNDYNPDEGELVVSGLLAVALTWHPAFLNMQCHLLLLAQYFENTLNQGFLTEKVGVACTTPVLTPSPHPVHRPRRGAIIGGRGAKRLPLSFVAQEAASSLPI